MLLWRLQEDFGTLLEGSCITEVQYRRVFYADKILFEMITDEEQKDLIEIDEKNYCEANGLKCILVYTPEEATKFILKLKHATWRN